MSTETETTDTEATPTFGSVKEIIEAAGGPGAIAARSEGTVSAEAVYKWPKIGIPYPHWPLLMQLGGMTEKDLLQASIAAREAGAEKAT